jgi:hypothetical protein
MRALNNKNYLSTPLNTISIQLEKLRDEQNIKKSFFSEIAASYGECHFLIKIGMGVLFTGVGALANVLLSISYPALGALIGFAAYFFPSIILAQHHNAEKKFQTSMSTAIFNLEHVMKKCMTSFQTITTKMKETLISLEEKNKEQEKNIIDLKITASSFKEEVKKSDDVLRNLLENQSSCINSGQLFSNTITRLNTTHEHFEINQLELSKTNKGLAKTQEKLQETIQSFDDLSQHASKSAASFATLSKLFFELQKTATTNNQQTEKYLAELQKRSYLSTETPEEQAESSASLAEKTLEKIHNYCANRFFENKKPSRVVSSVNAFNQDTRH